MASGAQNELPYPKSSGNREGVQQPGVNLALRLLNAIGAEPGTFMQKLADNCKASLPPNLSPLGHITISYEMPQRKEGQKSLFGLFLMQARVAGAVSQTAMEKAAGYNLRTINTAEGGRQDPEIMNALALVNTTGVDIEYFFNNLHYCWNELALNRKK